MPVGRKSSKSTVSYKNWFHFFILLSHSFTETDSKKGQVLWQVFWKDWNFSGSFMKPWYWHKMLKLSAQAEKNWNWRHAASPRPPVSIFSAWADSFNILAKSWFHETGRKIQPFKKTATKTALFTVSFSETGDKKKRNQFPY